MLYTPIVVVGMDVASPRIGQKSSGYNAVSRVIAWLAAAGEEVPSADTGGYSSKTLSSPCRA